MSKCFLCGKECEEINDKLYTFYKCSNCGNLCLGNDLYCDSSFWGQSLRKYLFYVYYNELDIKQSKYYFFGSKVLLEKIDGLSNLGKNLTMEMVENWHPKTFLEKADKILLNIHSKLSFEGDYYTIDQDTINTMFFCESSELKESNKIIDYGNQINFMLEYFQEAGLLRSFDKNIDISNTIDINITPKGYEKIYELQKNQSTNNKAFIAMAFNHGTDDTREAIRQGCINAGYEAVIVDEVLHGKQIVPEMLRLIRDTRFMIMDITDPNFGAYFEAGYAQGLGKEVIITCSSAIFNKNWSDEKLTQEYIKAHKPHFDIAQRQILIWDDDADLTYKLEKWINSII